MFLSINFAGTFTWTLSVTATAAVLNLLANAILIPRPQLMGAMWVSLFTHLVLTLATQLAVAGNAQPIADDCRLPIV